MLETTTWIVTVVTLIIFLANWLREVSDRRIRKLEVEMERERVKKTLELVLELLEGEGKWLVESTQKNPLSGHVSLFLQRNSDKVSQVLLVTPSDPIYGVVLDIRPMMTVRFVPWKVVPEKVPLTSPSRYVCPKLVLGDRRALRF